MTHQRKMCSVTSTFQCTRYLSHAVSVSQAVCRALPAHRQPNSVAKETRQGRGTLKNVVIIEHVARRLLLGKLLTSHVPRCTLFLILTTPF